MIQVDLCIFAHDEARGIAAMLAQFADQTVEGVDLRLLVLANGCRDATADLARAAGAPLGIEVVELAQGGKSRSWNRFVHQIARPGAEILIFCDADIRFGAPDVLARMIEGLRARPGLWATSSRPVKDLALAGGRLTLVERLILNSGGMLDTAATAICGQLYAMPAARARSLHLPEGLPVEDGFLRAMILTDGWSGPEDRSRIDATEGAWHSYPSERTLKGLLRHQTRLVIGSAINWACYQELGALPPQDRRPCLAKADEAWLRQTIRTWLPRWPMGYVPVHFAIKRLQVAAQSPRKLLSPKRLALVLLGFGFDLLVWLRAQVAMARGTGAGHW